MKARLESGPPAVSLLGGTLSYKVEYRREKSGKAIHREKAQMKSAEKYNNVRPDSVSRISIELPDDRNNLGTLTIFDVSGRTLASFPALGKADPQAASKYGNPKCLSHIPFGDTPLGNYSAVPLLPDLIPKHTVGDFGPGALLLLPERSWRYIMVHGGATEGNSLISTNGSVRLFDSDLETLLSIVGARPNAIQEIPLEISWSIASPDAEHGVHAGFELGDPYPFTVPLMTQLFPARYPPYRREDAIEVIARAVADELFVPEPSFPGAVHVADPNMVKYEHIKEQARKEITENKDKPDFKETVDFIYEAHKQWEHAEQPYTGRTPPRWMGGGSDLGDRGSKAARLFMKIVKHVMDNRAEKTEVRVDDGDSRSDGGDGNSGRGQDSVDSGRAHRGRSGGGNRDGGGGGGNNVDLGVDIRPKE